MKSSHTPGPWNVDLETGEIIAEPNGAFVLLGTIYGSDDFPCNENDITEECQANARLISAAPELLDACQSALDWIDYFGAHSPVAVGGEQVLHNALRVAIAKAKGES